MRLVRFEAFGFKSFADRTVLDFRGGITGFVGPNGCGKSNVVDAIRWALGEQSAKSLRGEEMQDVVFRGSRDRKPSGYAEVTLLFDNQDATLPIPHSEVALTRRLYRTGESEYLLNRQPCRLRDIKGLFLDTGIGVSAYSVIEQGRVGALVQGTAQDRRAILDEAAGISRFRAHVHQSMLKLERVEQNLLRVTDIRDEVDGRLKSIRRQASRARRYRELELEVRSARASLGHSRLRRLEAEADALRARRAELEDRCACAQAAQARTVADLAGIETRRALAEEARRTASEDLARAQEQARSCALRQEDATRRLADLGREREAVVLGRADVEGRIRAQEERLAALESEAARLDDDRRQAEEQVAGADARAAALQSGIRDAQQALERARTALMDAVRNESDAANERRGIEAELRAREEEAARLAEALSRGEEGIAALQGRADSLEGHVVTLRDQAKGMSESAGALRLLQEEQEGRERTLHERIEKLRYGIGKGESRMEVLIDLVRQREGVSRAVTRVLDAQKEGRAGISGVVGLLADFCEVDLAHAHVLDVALGDGAQALVVSTLGDAVRIADFVRRGEGGRVTLWPVNALGPEVKRPPLPRSDGVVGYAAELVDVPPEVRLVVDRALGDTLVVEDRETALRLRREECWLPLVTVDGERFVDGSHQVAGSGEALGLVARQVEIHRLKEEIEGDRSALDAESLAREAAAQERARLAAERERLETEHSGVQEALSRAAREHEVAKAALDEARARRAREGNSAAALQEACAQVRDRILRQETLVADGIRCAQERREEAASLVERLGGMETTSRALQEETARFREGAARLRERSGSLGEQRRTYREAASLLHSQREAASERACALDRQVGEVRDEQASLVQASEEAARRQVEARERAEAASSAHDALQQDHAASRASLQATERSSREAERALDAARGDLDRAEAKRGEWIAEHRREWGIDLEAEGAPAGEEVRSEEDLEGLLRAARGALEKMGSVNLEAISEQEELETRVSFLDMQLKDLTEAKRALGDLIARMNELSRERFAKTFTDVQEHFGGMFRKLFGGGKAELRLEEGVDLLDAGVEILARPPGKELMPISLLSGGEKALTAVSLLFGVFRSRPSPFCILDEVDAPLDESNIDRFLGVLKGFLDRSQFLIITHKKRTMRMADTLYGITQQEPGVSRWISLKFEDVAPSVSS